jgi:hypothetical protein
MGSAAPRSGRPGAAGLRFRGAAAGAFGSGRELLAICEQAGAVAAMAIVVPSKRGSWTTFQPAQAPLGLWLQQPQLDLEALLASLVRALPGLPLVFGLTQMDPVLTPRPAARRACPPSTTSIPRR